MNYNFFNTELFKHIINYLFGQHINIYYQLCFFSPKKTPLLLRVRSGIRASLNSLKTLRGLLLKTQIFHILQINTFFNI